MTGADGNKSGLSDIAAYNKQDGPPTFIAAAKSIYSGVTAPDRSAEVCKG